MDTLPYLLALYVCFLIPIDDQLSRPNPKGCGRASKGNGINDKLLKEDSYI